MPRVSRRRRRVLRGTAILLACAAGVPAVEFLRLPNVDELRRNLETSTVILDHTNQPLRYELTSDDLLAPTVRLTEVSPRVVEATLAIEDQRFRTHSGVDGWAVLRAAWSNLRQRRIVSGASTLTMQTARLLRPLRRSFYGKFREAILALWLEAHLTKDEILELYLSRAPYGGNVHGIEAASRRYFGRDPRDLSIAEAALLAGLPQAPSRLRPDRHPEAARRRRDRVLERMTVSGYISATQAAAAQAVSVEARLHPLPFRAPHFSNWVIRQLAAGSRVRTTLEPRIQALVVSALRRQLELWRPRGVRHGAVVVVENAGAEIRAFLGSDDFFAERAGQVNGADAQRSPGSLLKPFLFALAFEMGRLHPESVVTDTPRYFRDGYAPKNFSDTFLGPVTVREALARSLNIPAIDVLADVGVGRTLGRLRAFGLESLHAPPQHYGLALALGGAELSLLELVEAYSTLARAGVHLPLRFRADGPGERPRRVLERDAALEVTRVLEESGWTTRERESALVLPAVALKTGTSFGFRDAWSLAYTPRYTIGVWLGNFSGEGVAGLVGRDAAAPLALQLLRELLRQGSDETFARPAARRPAARGTIARVTLPTAAQPPHPSAPAPTWLSPLDGATYVRHQRAGGDQLELRATTNSEARLSFFVDDDFVGSSTHNESVFWPLSPGIHRVTLVPPSGKTEVRRFRVED